MLQETQTPFRTLCQLDTIMSLFYTKKFLALGWSFYLLWQLTTVAYPSIGSRGWWFRHTSVINKYNSTCFGSNIINLQEASPFLLFLKKNVGFFDWKNHEIYTSSSACYKACGMTVLLLISKGVLLLILTRAGTASPRSFKFSQCFEILKCNQIKTEAQYLHKHWKAQMNTCKAHWGEGKAFLRMTSLSLELLSAWHLSNGFHSHSIPDKKRK